MAYITRDDGEHFVIPSYRDVLTSKQKSVLKKEILLLSQNYGEYITLQKKGVNQYELAFSTETGYLLGESIWHYFKRPLDMIYCEAIPNTTEAIFVIVKSGSVYLDGRFPIDSIPEELVVFLTQQNNFEIYIYGDVPISKTPEEGKFSFETNSIKSFNVLEKPIFSTLPLLKIYQLQLVEQVLKTHGIGVFPARKVGIVLASILGLWLGYSWLTKDKTVSEQVVTFVSNPYESYFTTLMMPAPDVEIKKVAAISSLLTSAPNWVMTGLNYSQGKMIVRMDTLGGSIQSLMDWAKRNNASVNITAKGIFLGFSINLQPRPQPTKIYPLDQIIATMIDRMRIVNPGGEVKIGNVTKKGSASDVIISFVVSTISPEVVNVIGEQFKNLPVTLRGINVQIDENGYSGTITLEALGS